LNKLTEIAVILGGLTSILQPLDVFLNKPFKVHMLEQQNNWMISGEKSHKKCGTMCAASLDVLFDFVIKSLEKLKVETAINYTTEDTLDITRLSSQWHWFVTLHAVIFGVPISLTVCTLSNIPFVFGQFEFYVALLYIRVFCIEYVLVILGRFQLYKKHGEW
jgi:hypothetical protein